jgi:UrcA family protein
MLRSLAIAAAFAAVALPAAAASVRVDITGLDRAAAHAKIEKAAAQVCRVALSDETPLVQYYEHDACVTEAVSAAEAKLPETNHRFAKL